MATLPAPASILIVDDDPGLCRTMQMILEHRGYETETASDGAEAVERVRARPFDMVLMDVRMPVLNGVAALRQIKSLRPAAAVTLMTGYAMEELLADALAEGAFALLDKPLDVDKVIALVERARRLRQGALVLVVDDDASTRTTLQQILTRRGYQTCTADSGEEALARAHRCAFDILLVDLKLPELNGLDTYLQIRDIHPETVAIVLTGYPKELGALAELALRHSAYTCLYKPLDIDLLLNLMAEITKTRGDDG